MLMHHIGHALMSNNNGGSIVLCPIECLKSACCLSKVFSKCLRTSLNSNFEEKANMPKFS